MEHVQQKTVKASCIDKGILELFWTLAEGNDDSRVAAVSELVRKLLQKQKQDGAEAEMQYVLQRLVRGLASSRKFARLGFSMALTQILRDFDTVTVEDVLQMSEKCLVLKQQLTKSEAGNTSMGKAFVCLTLMQSGRLYQGSKQLIKKVVNQLRHLQNEKTYLHPVCIQALSLIITKVKNKVFEKYVFPELEKQLSKGWSKATPDDILLLLTCIQHQKETLNKVFIKKHWDNFPLISSKNFPYISQVLVNSTANFPQVHKVVDLIVAEVGSTELNIETFWCHCVHNLFDDNIKRQHLGLALFGKLLPHIDTAKQIAAILSPDIVICLMRHTEKKADPLFPYCKQMVDSLCDYLRSRPDRDIQTAVFTSLISKPSSPMTFGVRRQNILSTVVMNFSEETVKDIVKLLMFLICGKNSETMQLEGDNTEWACSQLNNILRICKVMDFSLRVSVIQFFCLHGFFKIKSLSNTLKHCDMIPPADKHTNVSSINFTKSLTLMTTVHSEKATKVEKFETCLKLLYEILQYADKLIKSPDVVAMRNPFEDEVQEEWDAVVDVVNKIERDRKGKVLSTVGLKEGFQLLYMFLALQMFTEGHSVIPIIKDVHVCYKKACQKRRQSMHKSSDDPHWMEVITEVLVSLLSQNSNLTRSVTKTVFKALADHTTRDSQAVIAKAVQPKKGKDSDDEEDMLSFEEDEVDSIETDSVGNEGDKDNEEDEDDDDENDDVSEAEDEVDSSFRQTVQAALGNAAENGDNDDSDQELPDFTDEQMFELDDKLAEAFRSLKKSKSKEEKEKKAQIVTFKTRVMDMVAILSKNPPSVAVSVDLLQTVLQVMESGDRHKEEEILYNKAKECLYDLCHQKKISSDGGVDEHFLFSVFQNLIQYSRKVTSLKMVTHISDACLFVISLLLNTVKLENGDPSPVKTRSGSLKAESERQTDYQSAVVDIVKSSLSDLLYRKDHRLHVQFFQNLLKKQSIMFWPLSDILLQVLQDDSVKLHSRTQACSLLAVLVNTSCIKELDEDDWKTFADQLISVLKQMILNLNEDKLKPMLVREVFMLTLKLFNVNRQTAIKMCTAKVRNKLDVLKAKLDTDTRRIFNKIYSNFPKEHTNGENNTEKKKKRKKHTQNEPDIETSSAKIMKNGH